ncbi:hypothetical protein [Lactobacillus hominis]|uniref:hypothetical protein n=1 Tax=Lactobacillus hominis TaxID=1203033 RepID=UPI0023F41D4C|nr:hypothetical protein [Lactobacillus hominis]
MQGWASLIREIALLISGVVSGITAWNALKKLSHDNNQSDKEELRQDRDLYRKRWLDSEKAYDDLDAENEALRKKIKCLESENLRGKQNGKTKCKND